MNIVIIAFSVFISMALLAILVESFYYLYNNSIYKNNASKIYFDINKECNINFEEKYSSLAKKHNSYAKKYIYTLMVLVSMIGVFVSVLIIGSLYLCLFFVAMIIIVLLIPKKNKNQVINDNKNINALDEKIKLTEKYYNIIFKDMIIKRFNGEKQKLIDSSILDVDNIDDVEEFEYKCSLIEEQQRKDNEFLSKLFEKTNKKYFKDFCIEFCINFNVNNKKIKLSRIFNNRKANRKIKKDITFRTKYINTFIGYLVEIPDFLNKEKLNNLKKNDYVLEENNTLYLLISDQIKSGCYSFPQDRFIPELYLKFEKNRFLEKNYIYFEELYKFICTLVEC